MFAPTAANTLYLNPCQLPQRYHYLDRNTLLRPEQNFPIRLIADWHQHARDAVAQEGVYEWCMIYVWSEYGDLCMARSRVILLF